MTRTVPNPTARWLVQVGKDKGSYSTKYSFGPSEGDRAFFYYRSLNTHSGYKKRLVKPDGEIECRYVS